MSSKSHILTAIRRHQPPAVELPSLDQDWITFPDPAAQFAETLAAVGGLCVRVGNLEELNSELLRIPTYAEAGKRCSLVPDIGDSTVDVAAIDDPHDLHDIDFAILPGQLAVAENAAVWVTDAGLRHRTLFFIPQHLALVVPASQVVDNLHQAYERLLSNSLLAGMGGVGGGAAWPRFSGWISGPSKTADIEQSLVIGAHGARSLTVFLVDA